MKKFKYLLFPLSLIFWGIAIWRNIFYKIGFFVCKSIPIPVVSIGNIMVGGSGKTPAIIYFTNKLSQLGYRVVILSRGYGRSTIGTVIVSDGEKIRTTWREAGDEPYFLAKRLSFIPIIVDEVRYRGGIVAMKKFHPDVILLDDGFQHQALNRDLDIVLLNSLDTPSDYKPLPYGKLREPLLHLRRADIIIWTKTNLAKPSATLKNRVAQMKIPQYHSTIYSNPRIKSSKNTMIPLKNIAGKRVYAFCGIAYPESFKQLLKGSEVEITGFKVFNDHHEYSENELRSILRNGKALKSELFITTEKDYYKVVEVSPSNMVIYALGLHFSLAKEEETKILTRIENVIKSKMGKRMFSTS